MEPSPLVLFADPDPSWSRPLRGALHRRGARVLSASRETELRRLAGGATPDVCVVAEWARGIDGRPWTSLLQTLFHDAATIVSVPAGTPAQVARERLRVGETLDRLLLGRLGVPERSRPLALCVDDDRFYLTSLARLLGRHGYRVATFEDPERALEAAPQLAPDVAILDVRMPGMSGLDLAEELRAATGDFPVVMLSALCTDADILRGYRRGASYYLTKPCDPRRVLNAVDYLAGDLEPEERASLETEL